MTNKLEQLKQHTVVVADTGDIEAIAKFQPQDATTNPSLLLKAAQMTQYQSLLADAVQWGKQQSDDAKIQLDKAVMKLMVMIGKEILQIIPGRVSTEVDARLSFDTKATIAQAHDIIDLYAQEGIDKDRVLIKIASTWEGLQAAQQLEKEGIHCNLTLLFQFSQAIRAADIGVTLISPFVGRIYDWYKNKEQRDYAGNEDPGVKSVTNIFNYYKKFNYDTIIMGASFRNTGQIEALSGCDYLTISPALLAELQNDTGALSAQLNAESAQQLNLQKQPSSEIDFRWGMNEDPMATEKLAEGIRAFSRDLEKLEQLLSAE